MEDSKFITLEPHLGQKALRGFNWICEHACIAILKQYQQDKNSFMAQIKSIVTGGQVFTFHSGDLSPLKRNEDIKDFLLDKLSYIFYKICREFEAMKLLEADGWKEKRRVGTCWLDILDGAFSTPGKLYKMNDGEFSFWKAEFYPLNATLVSDLGSIILRVRSDTTLEKRFHNYINCKIKLEKSSPADSYNIKKWLDEFREYYFIGRKHDKNTQ